MQPDPTTLDALAERVEAGEEGREMDAVVIRTAIGWHRVEPRVRAAPNLTGSLDAIEAARERLLPGSTIRRVIADTSCTKPRYRWACAIAEPVKGWEYLGFGPTERHARLAALLRAVAAKLRAEGERA